MQDEARIRELHAAGSLVNPIEHWGGLLTIAVEHDRFEMLKLLLDLGLDPDERMAFEELEGSVQSWGMPLWHAAGTARFEMATQLLERGADPNGQVYASGTPMFTAYSQRDEPILQLLRRHGGEVEAATLAHYRDTDGARKMLVDGDAGKLPLGKSTMAELVEDLLWGAACGGDPEIVRISLDRTDWPRDDPRWYRIFTQPIYFWNHMGLRWAHSDLDRGSYLECFKLVVDRCDINLRGKFDYSVLHTIAASADYVRPEERVAFANVALDAGATLDCRDDLLNSTPLGWACRWGRPEVVELFLSRGASAIEGDAEPWATPQAWAKKMDHPAVLTLLES